MNTGKDVNTRLFIAAKPKDWKIETIYISKIKGLFFHKMRCNIINQFIVDWGLITWAIIYNNYKYIYVTKQNL